MGLTRTPVRVVVDSVFDLFSFFIFVFSLAEPATNPLEQPEKRPVRSVGHEMLALAKNR